MNIVKQIMTAEGKNYVKKVKIKVFLKKALTNFQGGV